MKNISVTSIEFTNPYREYAPSSARTNNPIEVEKSWNNNDVIGIESFPMTPEETFRRRDLIIMFELFVGMLAVGAPLAYAAIKFCDLVTGR